MSSNARRLVAPDVQRFAWLGAGQPGTGSTGPAASGQAVSLPTLDDVRASQQGHMATLERESFTSGYAAGERAGLEAGTTRAEAMLRRLAQTLDELKALRGTLVRQTEQQMVQLALAIAKKILRREAAVDQDLIVAMARVALERVGESGIATIRLNPEDYASTVQRHGDHWAGARVKVVADPAVSRGGCLVESEFGFVDASVDAQFEQVAQAMADSPSQPSAASAQPASPSRLQHPSPDAGQVAA
jgi:flagellar assembly protein FliH